MPESMQAVCERIGSLDRTMGFAGMANDGKIVANKYQEVLVPLRTEK